MTILAWLGSANQIWWHGCIQDQGTLNFKENKVACEFYCVRISAIWNNLVLELAITLDFDLDL